MITVRDITGQASQIRRFVDFPYRLYRDVPQWTTWPRLLRRRDLSPRGDFPKHNPVRLFLGERDGEVVGTVSAQIDSRYNEHHRRKTGLVGFFECVNEPSVAEALLAQAERFLRDQGMEEVVGPASFSFNEELGFLVEGHDDPPAVMMPYTMDYYPELFRQCGYADARNLQAYALGHMPAATAKKINRLCQKVHKSLEGQLVTRVLNPRTLRADAQTLCEIYNEAWQDNWGFVPLDVDSIHKALKLIRWTVPREAMAIIELRGKPVGMTLIVPDIFEATRAMRDGRLLPWGWLKAWRAFRRIHRVRLILLGVLPEARSAGISLLLYNHGFQFGWTHPRYDISECGWVDEGNHTELARIGGHVAKRYVVLSKPLSESG